MKRFEELYYEAKSDKWFRNFAIFCRLFLAASFIPTGYVKIMGQRFAEGLPHNNPLGHYFDALLLTGYYYTFIGISQIIIGLLLLIPRTSLLGALMCIPMTINITVLTYATRFDGTRAVTMTLLANIYLLFWNYDRLKQLLPIKVAPAVPITTRPNKRLRFIFFGSCIAMIALIIVGTFYLHEISPGNSEEECRVGCSANKDPAACAFCDCIYKEGHSLDSCLAAYDKTKKIK
jgi:uncharacterized membrane protein YphA (DoxX/SURF4 family)